MCSQRCSGQVTFKREAMLQAAARGYATATDLADYLVRKGVPFRDAHEVVGKVVGMAIADRIELDQVPLSQLRHFSEEIEEDVYDVLSLEGSVRARNHVGGTAPEQVKLAARAAADRIATRG